MQRRFASRCCADAHALQRKRMQARFDGDGSPVCSSSQGRLCSQTWWMQSRVFACAIGVPKRRLPKLARHLSLNSLHCFNEFASNINVSKSPIMAETPGAEKRPEFTSCAASMMWENSSWVRIDDPACVESSHAACSHGTCPTSANLRKTAASPGSCSEAGSVRRPCKSQHPTRCGCR
jgi:hypothetical protein